MATQKQLAALKKARAAKKKKTKDDDLIPVHWTVAAKNGQKVGSRNRKTTTKSKKTTDEFKEMQVKLYKNGLNIFSFNWLHKNKKLLKQQIENGLYSHIKYDRFEIIPAKKTTTKKSLKGTTTKSKLYSITRVSMDSRNYKSTDKLIKSAALRTIDDFFNTDGYKKITITKPR